MNTYFYRDNWYTVKELSEMSDIAPATIRDRVRRGYPIEEAVKPVPTYPSIMDFTNASYYGDWLDKKVSEVYHVYWDWCIRTEYSPQSQQCFSRQILKLFPMLKIVPNHDGKYFRLRNIDTKLI